mgnify:CR=1 FL=1
MPVQRLFGALAAQAHRARHQVHALGPADEEAGELRVIAGDLDGAMESVEALMDALAEDRWFTPEWRTTLARKRPKLVA